MIEKLQSDIDKAKTLLEALPYFQKFRSKIFVIKIGGSAISNETLLKQILRDIVLLELVGVKPVIVHGGGIHISKELESRGIEAKFVHGLRVTDKKTVTIAQKVLSQKISPFIVNEINNHKGHGVRLLGREVFTAKKIPPKNDIDLGFVGEVTGIDTAKINEVLNKNAVAVISPIATLHENNVKSTNGDKKKKSNTILNINADYAATALAKKLRAAKLIFLSDVLGVLQDINKPESLIPSINESLAENLISQNVIISGMIPKVESAIKAIKNGVGKVHMIDGRIPHSLLLEVFTDSGIGTEFVHN